MKKLFKKALLSLHRLIFGDVKIDPAINKRIKSDQLRHKIAICNNVEQQKEMAYQSLSLRDKNAGIETSQGVICGYIGKGFYVLKRDKNLLTCCTKCARKLIDQQYSTEKLPPHQNGEHTIINLSTRDYVGMKLCSIRMDEYEFYISDSGRSYGQRPVPYKAKTPICETKYSC